MKVNLPKITAADEEMNMAPMIDMVFLLLIFFMVSSHLKQLETTPIAVPVATHSTMPQELSDRRVITVTDDEAIHIGGETVALDAVQGIVEQARQAVPHLKIYLRADKHLRHARVREVMKACAAGGSTEIIFATYETE